MKTTAFIPVRGGSKSIPGKNIQPFAGKPLVAWVLEAASACPEIDAVVVSTDSEEIATVVEGLGLPKVGVFRRSEETATDTATTESAMLEFARARRFETMVLIQATSPLLTAKDLSGGIRKWRETGADTLLSVVRQKRFLWREGGAGFVEPANYDPARRPRRQEFDGFLAENGAFYITPREGLLAHENRLFGRIASWEMPEATYVELDEPVDWEVLEKLKSGNSEKLKRGNAEKLKEDAETLKTEKLKGVQEPPNSKISGSQNFRFSAFVERSRKIRLVLTDVDGVLTDAGMYYSEKGDELKKFNTRDAVGLRLLQEAGLKVGILTSEETEVVAWRARKTSVDFLVQGARNKADELDRLLRDSGLDASEVAFIGDDVNDADILARVGLAVTPADGQPAIRHLAHYVCEAKGGEGAVREFAEAILETLKG